MLWKAVGSVQYEHITTRRELTRFCEGISEANTIAFDTEFVSEDSYRPHLCLVQVAAADRLAMIDAITINDMDPFWELVAAPGHETIVHAGRQEVCFCLHAVGKPLNRLFDTQIAAGMIGLEYPAAYGTLVAKLLRKTLGKGETRTDWRRRPLSDRQVDYALRDVAYLVQIRDTLMAELEQLGRVEWLEAEVDRWQSDIETAEFRERWRSVAGISRLQPRALAIVRALWRWREAEAKKQNRPPKRLLRDDLIAELAKRGSSDVQQIGNVRGMHRRGKQQYLASIGSCIAEAAALADEQCPQRSRRATTRPQLNVLGQFLSTALGSVCRARQIAPSLVGTVQDVRDFVAYRLNLTPSSDGERPALACGWRAEVVGRTIDELLAGKISIRVTDALADQPLTFEPTETED